MKIRSKLKVLSFVGVLVMAVPSLAGTGFGACADKYDACGEAKTCQAFYECQKQEYFKLNDLVYRAIDEVSMDDYTQCQSKRNDLEETIFAHATTIECVDTPTGPEFGG